MITWSHGIWTLSSVDWDRIYRKSWRQLEPFNSTNWNLNPPELSTCHSNCPRLCTQRNLFKILSNQTEIRLYLSFSAWFGTGNGQCAFAVRVWLISVQNIFMFSFIYFFHIFQFFIYVFFLHIFQFFIYVSNLLVFSYVFFYNCYFFS